MQQTTIGTSFLLGVKLSPLLSLLENVGLNSHMYQSKAKNKNIDKSIKWLPQLCLLMMVRQMPGQAHTGQMWGYLLINLLPS